MEDESRYLIHPSTVDACFQLIIISVHAGSHKDMPWGVVPTHIEDMTIFPAGDNCGSEARAVAWTEHVHGRCFNTNTVLTGRGGTPLIQVKNLTCTSYEAAVPASTLARMTPPAPFSQAIWKPDITQLTPIPLKRYLADVSDLPNRELKLLDLIAHNQPLNSALLIYTRDSCLERLESVFDFLPKQCSITIALCGDASDIHLTEAVKATAIVVKFETLSEMVHDADAFVDKDIIWVGFDLDDVLVRELPLPKSDGWILAACAPEVPSSSVIGLVRQRGDAYHAACVGGMIAIHNSALECLNSSTTVANGMHNHVGSNGVGNGKDGINGVAGTNGANGVRTHDMHHITNGIKTTNGTNGTNGIDGMNGANGVDRTSIAQRSYDHSRSNGTYKTTPENERVNMNGFKDKNTYMTTVLSLKISAKGSEQDLSSALAAAGSNTDHKMLTTFDPASDRRVAIDDSAGDVLSSIDSATFAALKRLVAAGVPTVWLTRGVNEGKRPLGGMAAGSLRVVRSENPSARIMLLDVDEEEELLDIGKAVLRQLEVTATKDSARDTEFWRHKGMLHIARVYPDRDLNEEQVDSARSLQQMELSLEQPLKASLVDGKVVFTNDDAVSDVLPDNFVDIQILASELLTAPGTLGIAVGTICNALSSSRLHGKRVIAVTRDSPRTIVRTSEFIEVGDGLEHVSSESIVALTALYLKSAGLRSTFSSSFAQGEHVVLLPTPKYIAYMTALLAKHEGWNLTVVTESTAYLEEYSSSRIFNGVRVLYSRTVSEILASPETQSKKARTSVIAHDFSSLSQDIWIGLKAGSRFYIFLDEDVLMPCSPDVIPFTRGASFIPLIRGMPGANDIACAVDMIVGMEQDHIDHLTSMDNVGDLAELLDSEWRVASHQHPQRKIVSYKYNTSQIKVSGSMNYDGDYGISTDVW